MRALLLVALLFGAGCVTQPEVSEQPIETIVVQQQDLEPVPPEPQPEPDIVADDDADADAGERISITTDNGRKRRKKRESKMSDAAARKERDAQLRAVFSSGQNDITRCYKRSLMQNGPQQGKLSATIHVGPAGAVKNIEIDTHTLGTELESCVVSSIRSWRFPATQNPLKVRKTWAFCDGQEGCVE